MSGLLTEPVTLSVGEVRTFEGAAGRAVALQGGADGAEYLYVPFFASSNGTARLAVEIEGANVLAPSGPPNPSLAPEPSLPHSRAAGAASRSAFHERLRVQERCELGPRLKAARDRSGSAGLSRSLHGSALAAPIVGEIVTLKVPDVVRTQASLCTDPLIRTGRIAAVSDRAIVVTDAANPPSGLTPAEFQNIANLFDRLVCPVNVRNFGEPTDIDENGRVILFYTRVVNELTEPGSGSVTGGFFFAGDLFPPAECPASNYAEIFYLLAPDAAGAIGGTPFTDEEILESTVGTTAHELQHLINASHRIYVNDAANFEEVWLNEGLSHIAEELIFYEVSGLQPRQNITVEQLRAGNAVEEFLAYGISNFGRFLAYVTEPDAESLLGIDNLPTRGASWAFLRYLADQEPGPDQELFFALVNSPFSGVANLDDVLDREAIDWMQDWTVSVYTDDTRIPVEPRFTQPSWNFRNIMSALAGGQGCPLAVRKLGSDAREVFDLLDGGAAFIRFGVPASSRALLNTTSGNATPPQELRISVVRIR